MDNIFHFQGKSIPEHLKPVDNKAGYYSEEEFSSPLNQPTNKKSLFQQPIINSCKIKNKNTHHSFIFILYTETK